MISDKEKKIRKVAQALMKTHRDWTWSFAWQRAEMLVNANTMREKRKGEEEHD